IWFPSKLPRLRLVIAQHRDVISNEIGDDLEWQSVVLKAVTCGHRRAYCQKFVDDTALECTRRPICDRRRAALERTIELGRAAQTLASCWPTTQLTITHCVLLHASQTHVVKGQDKPRTGWALQRQKGMNEPIVGVNDVRFETHRDLTQTEHKLEI